MPKVGDPVIYVVGSKTLAALVLAAHVNHAEHLGEKEEPLLHLAFIDPDRDGPKDRNRIGYLPTVFTAHDVPHQTAKKVPNVDGFWRGLSESPGAPKKQKKEPAQLEKAPGS